MEVENFRRFTAFLAGISFLLINRYAVEQNFWGILGFTFLFFLLFNAICASYIIDKLSE